MSQTVVGIFKDAGKAQRAVDELLSNGFDASNVDLSSQGSDKSDDDKEEITGVVDHDTDNRHESGIARFFRNLFGNNDESERYTRVAERGCVVTVYTRDEEEARHASGVLDDNGAVDVDEHYQQFNDSNYDSSGLNQDAPNANSEYRETDSGTLANNEGRTIPVIEENLVVGKKEIETGGVRIRSRIVEKPVEETLRLREEKIRVERNPVDRDAHPSDIDNFREETLELRERKEVPEVSKEARVVEEISLDRDVDHYEETIRDTVRHTEVDVENLKDKTRRDRDL